MRVLFASGIDGFCHRYAVLHWAEQLATQMIESTVRAHGDPRLAADLATHDVLVLYRVPHSPWIASLLDRARAFGRATVFAVDDLIFDPEIADVPALRQMDPEAQRLWHDGVARYRRTLLACDVFLATTGPLATSGRAAGKPTYIHRAGLAARELALGAAAADRARRSTAPGTAAQVPRVRLGYFSGTATHDEDFATIVPALAALLDGNPEVELVIGGHLRAGAALARFGARVVRSPFVPWLELPALIAGTDVSLAPLVWQHPFVGAKGAVKYLEAAAVGVPTVASPTEAYREAIRDGTTGLLPPDAAAWQTALATLVGDRLRRTRMGAAARADLAARFAPATQGPALAGMLAEVAARYGRRSNRACAATGTGEVTATSRAGVATADEVALARAFPGAVTRAAREPQARPGFAVLDCATTTPPLADGMVLVQRFRASDDGLTRVDVHTVTYGQTLDHRLEARLLRDDGTTIALDSLAAVLAPDRDWLAFEFRPETRSAGRSYTLELRARGTGPGNALSFGAAAHAGAEGPFTLAGRTGAGSLTLRTFAAEPEESGAIADAC